MQIGVAMFYARTNKPGSEDSLTLVLSLLWQVRCDLSCASYLDLIKIVLNQGQLLGQPRVLKPFGRKFSITLDLFDHDEERITSKPCLRCGRRGGLMFSALDSGSSGLGSGPSLGHCVVLLGKTLYSHGPANLLLGVALCWTSIPSRGE